MNLICESLVLYHEQMYMFITNISSFKSQMQLFIGAHYKLYSVPQFIQIYRLSKANNELQKILFFMAIKFFIFMAIKTE